MSHELWRRQFTHLGVEYSNLCPGVDECEVNRAVVVGRGPHLETEVVLAELSQGGDGEQVLSLELAVNLSEVGGRHGLQEPGHRLLHAPRLRGDDVVDQV